MFFFIYTVLYGCFGVINDDDDVYFLSYLFSFQLPRYSIPNGKNIEKAIKRA